MPDIRKLWNTKGNNIKVINKEKSHSTRNDYGAMTFSVLFPQSDTRRKHGISQ